MKTDDGSVAELGIPDADIRALEAWYHANARDLPWRRRRNGYTALVAESMLQQTQVERVRDRFTAFLRRFPSVAALAEADEQAVLAEWQGLGYYRRARSLHAAARAVVAEHGGRVPRTASALRTLPGVGPYTAGAIASIVYGERAAIVDGNVQRVLARWAGNDAPPNDTATVKWTWATAGGLVTRCDDPGVFNEALMELGATVCTPKTPSCVACPVRGSCVAHRTDRVHEIPPPKTAPPRRTVHFHTCVIRRGTRVLFEQRPGSGLWSRMWQTPTVEAGTALAAVDFVSRLPVTISDMTAAGRFVHQTTHRRVEFHVYTAMSRARRGVWRAADDLADLPMSNAQRRVLEVGGVGG